MTVFEYLQQKYKVAIPTTILFSEAKIFGITVPLQPGWLAKHGSMEISQPMACRLIQSLRHKRSNLFALDALSILGAEPGPKPQSAAERKAKKRVKRAASRARRDQAKAVYQAPIKAIGHAVASPEFLLTFEWRKLRMVALKKYGAKCQCCGATPATGAVMNVDHIKPRKFCPELALEITNLQILCGECNHGKGNWDTTDWRNSQNL